MFPSSYMAMFRKKMLAIVICKSVSHFAPVIGILLALFKDLKPIARLIKNMSNIPKSFPQRTGVFMCFSHVFSFPTFFSRVPTAKKCCTEKAKATMFDVTCAKTENSNVAEIPCRPLQRDDFLRPPFGSKPLPVLWTSNGGPRHEENGQTWKNVRLEMMVENAMIMWEKTCNMTGTNKK